MGSDQDSLLKIFENRFGSEQPFFNPNGVPCFVLCASRHNEGADGSNESEGDIYEPFLLRTYEYPQKKDDSSTTTKEKSLDFDLAQSTSSVSLYEAMAATSAVPGLVDRVNVNVEGVERYFADGFVYANNPIVLALNEAKQLYPTRPLGLVMSIGFNISNNDYYVNRAIDICRLSHPSLHYHRICPAHIFESISEQETDLKKIAVMEEKAFDYVMNNAGVNRLLDVSLEKLFAHKPEWQEGDNYSKFRRSSILDKSISSYNRRTKQRLSKGYLSIFRKEEKGYLCRFV